MSFLGLATKKDLEFIDRMDSMARNGMRTDIKNLTIEIKKNRESIRYLKDELSKIKRGKTPGQTTFKKLKAGGKKHA